MRGEGLAKYPRVGYGVAPVLRIHTLAIAALASSAALVPLSQAEEAPASLEAVVSVADQKIAVLCDGMLVAKYPVSTSRFGIGDGRGTYKTPLGRMRICEKLGDNLSSGAVIKHRQATGEVLAANAPGRDPIVTRILWLDGMEPQNINAKERSIYIHGTPMEKLIGRPASYGCIRMKSQDVIDLYKDLGVGSIVRIIPEKLPRLAKYVPRPAQPQLVAKITPPPVPAPAPKLVALAKPEPEVAKPAPVPLPAPKIVAAAAKPAPTPAPKIAIASAKPVPTPVPIKPDAAVAVAKAPGTKPAPMTAPADREEAAPAIAKSASKTTAADSAPKFAATSAPKRDAATLAAKADKPAPIAAAPAPLAPAARKAQSPRKEEVRLAAIALDPERLQFLKTHESALAANRSANEGASHSSDSTADLVDRMKGSILDSGLSSGGTAPRMR